MPQTFEPERERKLDDDDDDDDNNDDSNDDKDLNEKSKIIIKAILLQAHNVHINNTQIADIDIVLRCYENFAISSV